MRTPPIERTPIISKRMFNRIARFFPVSNARPRVDDRFLCSTEGAPLDFVITAGNVSDAKVAEIII